MGDWVRMTHPDVTDDAVVTQQAFDEIHSLKGWVAAETGLDEPIGDESGAVLPERALNADGTVADGEYVEPQRQTVAEQAGVYDLHDGYTVDDGATVVETAITEATDPETGDVDLDAAVEQVRTDTADALPPPGIPPTDLPGEPPPGEQPPPPAPAPEV